MISKNFLVKNLRALTQGIALSLALAVTSATQAQPNIGRGQTSAYSDNGPGISKPLSGFQYLQSQDQRLLNIGYRLTTANARYCGGDNRRAGFQLHDIEQYPDQDAARAAYGFDTPIAVNTLVTDSPAAVAGLQVGDNIIAINGQSVIDIAEAVIDADSAEDLGEEQPGYRRIAAINRFLQQSLQSGALTLTIARQQATRTISFTPAAGCASDFEIAISEDRLASANGRRVRISTGFADYFLNDDEFAAVAAHELAHNLLKHRERLDAQEVNRSFFGQFGKNAERIKATEIEADRLSVWLMANAGYDPQAAIRFWTRYGKQHGKGIFSASTHYRWKKRVELFTEEITKMATVEPIDRKRPPPLLVATPGAGIAHEGQQ